MAVELPYTIAWTRAVVADGSGRHLVDWTVTDNASTVVLHGQKIYNPTDPAYLISRDIRASAMQALFVNVVVQDIPASGSFTSNIGDVVWPSPL